MPNSTHQDHFAESASLKHNVQTKSQGNPSIDNLPDSHPLILLVFANDPQEKLDNITKERDFLLSLLTDVANTFEYDIKYLEKKESTVKNLITHLDANL